MSRYSPRYSRVVMAIVVGGASLLAVAAFAQQDSGKFRAAVLKMITDRNPEVRVDKVDRDRLSVHRIDLVDKNGIIRMTLAAEMPDAIIDGIAYKRRAPVSGIMVRDDHGNERGGYGYMAATDSVIMTVDHHSADAAGLIAQKDGSISFGMNAAPAELHEPTLGNRLLPGQATNRIKFDVQPDGTPEIYLADKQERPRLRLTVTKEGYGAVQFLDAKGEVIQTLAPQSAASGS